MARYNNNYLKQFCKENQIVLRKDYDEEKVTRETRIIAKCVYCDDDMIEKSFRVLAQNKNFNCKSCQKKSTIERRKNTNLERFGVECSLQNEEIKQRIKNTNLERYGVENVLLNKDIRRKIKETNLEKYGVENVLLNKDVRRKIKETTLKNYGVEYVMQNDEIKQKSKNTNLEKYGVENPAQNKEIRQKMKNTNLERYGHENAMQNKDIKQKALNTNLERYGVEHPIQNKGIKQKIKDTNLERYGVEYPVQDENVKQKTRNTNLERYGAECSLQNVEVKQKIKETCLEKYGRGNPMQNKDIKQKALNTNLERYGFEHPVQNKEIKQKIKDTNLERYGYENAMQNEDIQQKTKNTNLERYGTEHPSQNNDIKQKTKDVFMKKYGVTCSLQNEEVKRKTKVNNIKKYGCEHPMQNSEIADKSAKNAYKLKDYVLPSGKIIKVQGYENFGLDELLKIENIDETDIITTRSKVPIIWYEDDVGKLHRYYVDIYIPSQNRCIEIKSTWTFEKKKDLIFLKQKATIEKGYVYEIWIYNGKGEKVISFKEPIQKDTAMIKLAIVGGRDFRNYKAFECIVKKYIQEELDGKYPNFIVSGGAEGVDTMAEIFASLYDIETIIYEPKNFNREELLGRNTQIVDECTHCLALPTKDSRGTYDSINKARARKKILKVVNV